MPFSFAIEESSSFSAPGIKNNPFWMKRKNIIVILFLITGIQVKCYCIKIINIFYFGFDCYLSYLTLTFTNSNYIMSFCLQVS